MVPKVQGEVLGGRQVFLGQTGFEGGRVRVEIRESKELMTRLVDERSSLREETSGEMLMSEMVETRDLLEVRILWTFSPMFEMDEEMSISWS